MQDPRSADSEPIGRVLAGKYRIDALLKRGGMGAVYRATHLMLRKPIAIKLIKPELVTSEDTVRRFHREAQAASRLDHPNIVTIHDLGQAEDGTLYIAMELVSGTSLKELVKTEGPLPPQRAIGIAKAIGSALSLAHRNHIIHRDLKPQNIMVGTDAEGKEQPKLLDFGIAKTFESEGPALTSTGLVLGTPHYMSPEQAKGTTVDGRSDLYALGIILYEMLVGKVPFDDTSIPAILIKHLNEKPKPPTELRPGLDAALEAVVLRCLEKEPGSRYQSAEELTRALDAAELALTKPGPPPIPKKTAASAPALDAATNRATQPTVRVTGRSRPPASPASRSGSKGLAIVLGAVALLLLAFAGAAYWGIGHFLRGKATSWNEQATEASGEVPQGTPAAAPLGPPASEATEEPPIESLPEEDTLTVVEPLPEPGSGGTPSPTTAETPGQRVTPVPPGSESAPAPLPANPPVQIRCEGLSDACASLRSELQRSLEQAGLSLATASNSEVIVSLYTEEIESRTEEQFGTTFVVRTYSMEASGEAPRFGESLGMPPPEVFSFDARFGRDKLTERSRVLAQAITQSIRDYWSRRGR